MTVFRRGAGCARTFALLAAVASASAACHDDNRAEDAAQPPDTQTAVISGNARFEVLSPTLIRTEYAGDARFLDAPTFNAIGRDGFGKTSFTTRTEDGWLVIDTGALTLRYEVGSGQFTDENLVVRLKVGAQDVEARPWASQVIPTCALGVLCEAEGLALEGISEARDHTGFTGTGFAAGFEGTGTRVTFQVAPEAGGSYVLDLRYANGLGDPRTLTLTVDGGSARQFTLPRTGNWDSWGHMSLPLDLTAGPHVVALTRTKSDTGQLNIDSLALLKPGAAYPQSPKTCGFGERCEAEDLALNGRMHLATDHPDYTGNGFAAGFEGVGDSIGFDIDAPAAGDYELTARYANGFASQAGVTLTVEGGSSTPVPLPSTGNWDTWKPVTVPVHLAAGTHHVTLVRQATDAGNVNIDSLAIGPVGTGLPASASTAGEDCGFGSICEAESAGLSGGATTAKDHNGYSGKGFAAGLDVAGSQMTVRAVDVPAAGTYSLQLRYARGLKTPGAVTVQAGTGAASTLTLPPTSDWDSWRTVRTDVTLPGGTSDVRLSCPQAGGCVVNVDTVALTKTDAPLLAPHAALGGYRRGLDAFDGNNGSPILNPGLLYQDGWSLLDDTASAAYDPASGKPTPRAAHPGGYQDGYVFGYGQDYPRALGDLAKLTGPSKLLPRWAYGVWFSEYLDRTAADFQEALLPRFRKEGVPLDVLVVDTDFKAGNSWNGWEIDTRKFPDPKGFFDWARSQGLHTTLNMHPSILPTDPQFAAAQATAKGKLTQHTGGCSGGASECYTFDFGDPDQLKAFFGLHDTMKQQGTDFWWLDWCCDASEANIDGVTGDAWINQQYTDYTNSRIGRGFAFSRAFGSLQAGGYSNPTAVPTGPWADKRTTLPFTGDTTSTWGTLAAEVGFTSGEGAATGLSAISHDIGGHNGGLWGLPGSDVVDGQRTDKLPDDLYARWVQFGTFQPIDRLHSNHGDRLPWQYPGTAGESAKKFLNLREALVPYTYTLAREAEATGVPVVRPTYLAYPTEQDAYATAGSEYLYGSDVLVVPVTTPGNTATTTVWFPPGSSWTDWFTGKTYAGGTTQSITTGLDTMPVFVKSGGIVPTRSEDVTNDVQNPLDAVTLTVAAGAMGHASLFEDDGTTSDRKQSTRTDIRYTEGGQHAALRADGPDGSFAGQVQKRAWTVRFVGAQEPESVTIDGKAAPTDSWTWDAVSSVLTVKVAERPTSQGVDVAYQYR
ncbi:glycoside hydrolase family 31 protein [Stigmatella sp. ncwal1]|uniref:Glycoside hydrolase family 31 protein n=1 Tax=Stigmatella ashevillensis TaxID=2995309 RepID=A0ABT5DQ68_9BACT|nr:TIM-barrel domain-containing protein [Stigmatella ashevillena]MDC0714511.1 glycoside hydrolase family 31 protein [Stigmatella ashevillena]